MHYLFLWPSCGVGGVETIIVRKTRYLVERGDRATFLTPQTGEMAGQFAPGVRVMPWRRYNFLLLPLYAWWFARRHCADVDRIVTFERTGLWQASLLSRFAPRRPGLVCLAYSPWEMRPRFARAYGVRRMAVDYPVYFYDRVLPDSQKAFMSTAVQAAHESVYRRRFTDAAVIPLTVERQGPALIESACRRGRIVSVGRLDGNLKQYNVSVIPVIRWLLDRGHQVEWDIYGDGELVAKMREAIARHGLGAYVHLKGTIEHRLVGEALAGAMVFVGMGNASVEAALHGVPAIVAQAATDKPLTHGFLHQQPFGVVGEIIPDLPAVPIGELIEQVLRLDGVGYADLCRKELAAAQWYSPEAVMPVFIKFVADARPAWDVIWKYFMFAAVAKWVKVWRPRVSMDADFFDARIPRSAGQSSPDGPS